MIFISGPCQIESRDHCLRMAERIATIAEKVGPIVFKASFDKANRTSGSSARGVGLKEAVNIFAEITVQFGLRVTTDVHEPWHCAEIAPVVDIIQIPALLSRQTDLIAAAGKTRKIVSIKKGQFMAPDDIDHAVRKAAGAKEIWAIERGTSFGYHDLVVDMRSFKRMRFSAAAVIFDATHSVQTPNGLNGSSGGRRELIEPLALAALAAGAEGLFIETHDDPDNALSDGPCMLPVERLEPLLRRAIEVQRAVS